MKDVIKTIKCSICGKDSEIKFSVYIKHPYERTDAYSIFTCYACDDCYEDESLYRYKKDLYFDPDYIGERLEGDY